jgi:hypothetical protein
LRRWGGGGLRAVGFHGARICCEVHGVGETADEAGPPVNSSNASERGRASEIDYQAPHGGAQVDLHAWADIQSAGPTGQCQMEGRVGTAGPVLERVKVGRKCESGIASNHSFSFYFLIPFYFLFSFSNLFYSNFEFKFKCELALKLKLQNKHTSMVVFYLTIYFVLSCIVFIFVSFISHLFPF